ncbi:hypothetical protein ABT214_15640 [Micromonospora purpureochromogenes]|uniref:hypothetical protein n=1 Tax=Micromonospora purpureochromogenes TaxID=47872 RepID=UPI0033240CE2
MRDVFAYFDGDNIGSRLELLLLDDNVAEAEIYSASVTAALEKTRRRLQAIPTLRVILAGGDDIFVRWTIGAAAPDEIEDVRAVYKGVCGQSLSVGIGLAPSRAIANLRKAKLRGKAQLVSDPGSFDGAQSQ